MEELVELRRYIEEQRYTEALDLITEIEDMSREDKINKICNFAEVLLLHLIKQEAEKHTTRSWELSIRNALRQITRINRRRKSDGRYVDNSELSEIITEAYQPALELAALEAFEGQYDEQELNQKVDRAAIERKALELIVAYQEGRQV